jgi:hypothetical protein
MRHLHACIGRTGMTRKSLRNLFCAAAAAVFGAYGTAAHAIAYDIGFDPFDFAGIMQIDVSPTCFSPFPADNACAFNVLSVNFTDSLNRAWTISGPDLGIGDFVRVDATDTLIGVDVDIFNLQPVGFSSNCDGASLHFQLAANFAFGGPATFDCGGGPHDTGTVRTITRVPEPATLALLGLGLSGLALTRRRKPN